MTPQPNCRISKKLSTQRFLEIEKRFAKDKEFYTLYKELIRKNIINRRWLNLQNYKHSILFFKFHIIQY